MTPENPELLEPGGKEPEPSRAAATSRPLGCRGVSWSAMLLAAVCFFMPWFKGCDSRVMTGWETVRWSVQNPLFFPVSGYPLFLVVGLISALWFFRKGRPLAMIAACLCAAGSLVYFLVLWLLPWGVMGSNFSILDWLHQVWDVATRMFFPPYWIALTALIVAVMYGVLEDRFRGHQCRFPWFGCGLYVFWAGAAWGVWLLIERHHPSFRQQAPNLALILDYTLTVPCHIVAGFFILRALIRREPPSLGERRRSLIC